MGLEALEALRFDNRSQMKEPLDHLPDANAWHYFLQLNVGHDNKAVKSDGG